ncbi:hypothetical protein L211DRAFT_603520 [Terfezia boudieri ATCC MYA-4762]|uniref:Uncharacterized protein n=1 Tax=Terfezia boudieri ATCC MYA-4762 TaxID=1051890 RepID=A0A3N4LVU1_9PEZI|nr:hypothetical protein L211DRAFT_603520 [Terfezia boudieri ATCC MYA-4762]
MGNTDHQSCGSFRALSLVWGACLCLCRLASIFSCHMHQTTSTIIRNVYQKINGREMEGALTLITVLGDWALTWPLQKESSSLLHLWEYILLFPTIRLGHLCNTHTHTHAGTSQGLGLILLVQTIGLSMVYYMASAGGENGVESSGGCRIAALDSLTRLTATIGDYCFVAALPNSTLPNSWSSG